MSTGNRWRWRALWALAACVWLATLPAMAMEAAGMARDSVHKVDVLIASSAAQLRTLEKSHSALVSGHEKGGPSMAGTASIGSLVV